MENPQSSNPKSTVPPPEPQELLRGFKLENIKDMKSLQKFLPLPINNSSVNIDKIAESIKTNPSFDYKEVVDIVKNSKSIDPSK